MMKKNFTHLLAKSTFIWSLLTLVALRASAQTTVCHGETGQGAYYTGTYRNVFKEFLNKTDTEINSKVSTAYNQIFAGNSDQKLYYEVGNDMAYIWDVHNNDVRTEGMSYGMMICVQLNKQAEFNKIWKWAKTKMQYTSGNYQGYFAWQLNTDGTIKGNGPASDGEAYFVTALFFAANRWGNGTGIFNYEAEAQDILSKVMNKNGTGQVYPLFNTTSKLITFVPSYDNYTFTDPSYNLPGFWELWKRWSNSNAAFWAATPDASRTLLRAASNPTSGLFADYSNFDGTPKNTSFNSDSHRFMYDAWRTIMNIGMDYHWFKADPQQPIITDRYLNFFKKQGAGYKNHYNWDGSNVSGEHSTGLVACNAVAALASSDVALATPFVQEFWNIGIPSGQYRYYDGMLYMLALLNCSGNFKVWDRPCEGVNKYPTVSISSPANKATFTLGTDIVINAIAGDADGSVSKVEFFYGETKLGEDTEAPYSYTWKNAPEGIYSITAKATDDKEAFTISDVVSITVGNPLTNLVANGEFDSSTDNWTLQLNNSTTGTMTVATDANMSGTNALRICPTSAGNADWNVQVSQPIGIQLGKSYTISYSAKADATRPMTTIVQQGGGRYKTYLGAPVSLTTISQPFTHTFVSDTTDASALIKFFVGNNTTCVTIDNVVVNSLTVTGIETIGAIAEPVLVYPNPFGSNLTVVAKGRFTFQIINQLGQVVETGKAENVATIADNLTKGVYFVSIENETGKKKTKVVKE